jgi:hypothetical protein
MGICDRALRTTRDLIRKDSKCNPLYFDLHIFCAVCVVLLCAVSKFVIFMLCSVNVFAILTN